MSDIKKYLVYTDGSSTKSQANTPNFGSWAYAIIDMETQEIVQQAMGHTKEESDANHMEVMAAIEAVKNFEANHQYVVVSDSDLVRNIFLRAQEGNPYHYHNKRLQHKATMLAQAFINNESEFINCVTIKGHAGDFYNFYVDFLARKASKELLNIAEKDQVTMPAFNKVVAEVSKNYYWSEENQKKVKEWFEPTHFPVIYKQEVEDETLKAHIKLKHLDTPQREELMKLALEQRIKLTERGDGRIRIFNWQEHNNKFVDYLIEHPRRPLITTTVAYFDVDIKTALILSQNKVFSRYQHTPELQEQYLETISQGNLLPQKPNFKV